MAAANTDKFMEIGNPGTATTLSAPGYTAGGTSITVGSTSNWPTATGIAFAIDEAEVVDGKEVQIAGTYNEFVGTVSTGTSVTNVDWVRGVGDRSYSAGALTRVYVPVSAERENRLAQGMLVAHNQDGTLKAGAVSSASVLASDVVTTAKILDSNITTAKLADSNVTTAKIADGAVTPAKMLGIDLFGRRHTYTGATAPTAGTGQFYIQAGSDVVTTNAGGDQTITFPTAFPNAVISVVATDGDDLSTRAVSIQGATTTVFNFSSPVVSGNVRINWIAIGW